MSAYIVDRHHVEFLVLSATLFTCSWYRPEDTDTYSRQLQHVPFGDREAATRVGQMLWDENIASVQHKYPGEAVEALPGPCDETYVFTPSNRALARAEPAAVLKACDCFEYQSCEHPGWRDSEAFAFINALRANAWRRVPGYKEAAWEVLA